MVGSRSPSPFHFLRNYKLPCISEEVGVISIWFMMFKSLFLPRKYYTIVGCCQEQVFPFASARIIVLLLNFWCNISPNQRAERR